MIAPREQETHFYIAFIVDEDIKENGTTLIESGIDILAGPFLSEDCANDHLHVTCAKHSRLAALCGLSTFLNDGVSKPIVRIDIISVTKKMVKRYNKRHKQLLSSPDSRYDKLQWPLRVLTSKKNHDCMLEA